MTEAHVSLLLPQFAPLLSHSLNRALIPPSLKKLIRRARFDADTAGFQRSLWRSLSAQPIHTRDLPDSYLISDKPDGICVAPCHIHADRDTLRLFHRDLSITAAEAEQMIALIHPLLEEKAIAIQPVNPMLWLLELRAAAEVEFTPLDEVGAQTIDKALPRGVQAGEWIRLWNEIQMQLFDCELNQQREQQGKLSLNSVWFWGQGRLPIAWKPWRQLSGLTQQLLNPSLPFKLGETAQGLDDINALPALHCESLVWDGEWEAQLAELEMRWFKPLLHALKQRKLHSVEIIVPELGCYQLSSWSAWACWR